jgi:hypothetical protein
MAAGKGGSSSLNLDLYMEQLKRYARERGVESSENLGFKLNGAVMA